MPHLPIVADIKEERALLMVNTPTSGGASGEGSVTSATMVNTAPLIKNDVDDLKRDDTFISKSYLFTRSNERL